MLLDTCESPARSIQAMPPVNPFAPGGWTRLKYADIAAWSVATTAGAAAIAFSCALAESAATTTAMP